MASSTAPAISQAFNGWVPREPSPISSVCMLKQRLSQSSHKNRNISRAERVLESLPPSDPALGLVDLEEDSFDAEGIEDIEEPEPEVPRQFFSVCTSIVESFGAA